MGDTGLIIKTKLDVPQTKGKILRRERLLNILKDNLDRRLILICADAGYGKTTLLAQFCQEAKQPHIFYDLDAQDNDIATFFNYLIAGMQRHAADFGSRVTSVISEKRDNVTIAGTFINEFVEKINGEFFIILDDYHRINKSRKIADIINYLLRHLPRNLHIIISSRTTPPIYLSYYLAKQELLHLDKEHLQFDIRETQILMREIYGLDLQEDEITQIAELSEGWVTVIQLILQKLSVTPGRDIKETLGNYATSGEDVFDYFAQEVFKYQTKAVRDFLIKTSVLEYLNAQICDHVLSIADSKKIIDQLETDHIFVLRTGGNLIYHPLFQEFLYKKLTSSYPPQSIRRLHVSATRYFYDRKEFSSAVSHLLAAGQYTRAAKILERHADYWCSSGEYAGFVRLADRLPASFIEKYPYLLLKRASMKYELMKGEQAAKDADKALKRLRRKRDYRGMAQAYKIKWHICHSLMQSQKALYYIKRACEFAGKRRSSERTEIMINLGTAYRVLGRFKKAQSVLHEALQMARLLKSSQLECKALHQLGMLYYNMSDFRRARDTFMEIVTRFRDQVYPLELAYIYRTIASIAVDSGDVDKALDYITRTEQIIQEYCEYYLKCYLVLLRGRIEAYKADYPRAIELFKEAIALNRESDVKITDLYALLDMVDVYLKMGNVHSAHEALDRAAAVLSCCQDIPQHVVGYEIAKGKLETAEGNFDAAWASFQRALKVNKKVFDPIQTLFIYYALSEYFLTLNDISEALTCFKKCLAIAEEHEFETCLVCAGRNDTRLFEFALEQDYMRDFVLKVMKRIDTDRARDVVQRAGIVDGEVDLRCDYLGRFEIRNRHEQILKVGWRTNRAKLLFVMLSVNHPQGCSRDELIEACWPHKQNQQAAHSLQVEVSSLRKMITGLVASKYTPERIIACQNQKYILNPDLCLQKDIQEFESLTREAAARESTERTESMRLYERALSLYRGDFCIDLSQDWCVSMRAHYREMAFRVLKKLAQFNYDMQNIEKALALYRQAEDLDRYDEAVHIGIMRCMAAVQDADGVQQQYRILVTALKELDISLPSPEATEIYQASMR